MIASRLADASGRLPAVPGLAAAAAFLRRPDIASLPDGRYEIEDGRVFALVQRYSTEAAARPRFEAHRKFTDVQYIAAGAEVIGWAPLEGVTVSEPYDGEKDACFGAAEAWSPVRLAAGELAVFFPEDAHAPRLAAGSPGPVTKVVVKVAV